MRSRILIGVLVAAALAGGTFWSLEAREASKRRTAAEPLLAPLPLDAAAAGEALALRVAYRVCSEPEVERSLTYDEDVGGQTGYLLAPSCLGPPEDAQIGVSVTTGERGADGLVVLANRNGVGCLATPRESDRVLVRHFRGEGGYRCPAPGCRCPIHTLLHRT